jgi:hypothetical protein
MPRRLPSRRSPWPRRAEKTGDYAGRTIVSTIVITSTDLLACASPSGLTSTSGPFLVTVL